jgi:hypothetical protein
VDWRSRRPPQPAEALQGHDFGQLYLLLCCGLFLFICNFSTILSYSCVLNLLWGLSSLLISTFWPGFGPWFIYAMFGSGSHRGSSWIGILEALVLKSNKMRLGKNRWVKLLYLMFSRDKKRLFWPLIHP